MKKSHRKGGNRISKVHEMKMRFIIDNVTEIVERLELKIKEAALLACPTFVI